MARGLALAAAIVVSLLAVSGAGGSGAQTPKRGGTVVFGPDGEGECLNPLGCGFFLVFQTVLRPAFAVAPDSTLKPRLVSSATYTKRPPFTITYHIRREARWSDGVPVTARDFVFTHNAIRKLVGPGTAVGGIHHSVRSIRPLDAKTVRVVLRSREAGWRSGLFTTVLPRHALRGENLESVWSDDMNNAKTGKPIGSGPFLVESWERGKRITLVRNRNYWGPHVAYLDRLVIRFLERRAAATPSEVLELLGQGEVDFASTADTAIVPDLRRMSAVRFFRTTQNTWEHIVIRTRPGGHPALQDKRVRQAIAYGIDRVAIVRRLFGELDPRYRPSDSAIFLGGHESYRPNWAGYRYKPEESKRLLRLAGCTPGADGIYVCAGGRLELRLMTTAGNRVRERTIELAADHLRRAGIAAIPTFIPGPALFGQVLPSGDFDLMSFTRFFSADPSGKKNLFGCRGPQNNSGYCQRLVTSDLDQADRILDAGERSRVLNRADRQLAKDVPVIPLYDVPFVLALRNTVRNVVVSPENLFWNVEDWWLDD